MAKTKAPRLVAVHWLDAVGQRHDEPDLKPVHCISFGFIVEMTDEYVKVASEIIEDGSYQEVTLIPRGMVQGIAARAVKLPPQFAGWSAKSDTARAKKPK